MPGAIKKHNQFHNATPTQGQESNLHYTLVPCLSAAKDQKALNIDSTKAMPAQQFPATVNRALGHNHNAHICKADASLTQQPQDVRPVARTSSTTSTDTPLGAVSRPISILAFES